MWRALVSVDLVFNLCLLASLCVKTNVYTLNLRVVDSPPVAHTRVHFLHSTVSLCALKVARFQVAFFIIIIPAASITMRCRSGRVSDSTVNETWCHVVCESLRLIVVHHKRKNKPKEIRRRRKNQRAS